MRGFYAPAPSFAGHPYVPERLGYMRLLGLVRPSVAGIVRTAKPYTLMTVRNLTTLYREGERTLRSGVEGDFIEIGVHRGGSAGILAALIKERSDRQLHLFDRWGDLPDPTEHDGAHGEEYRKDRIPEKLAKLRDDPPLERTRRLIEEVIGFPRERLHYYPGWYSETFARYSGAPLAFISLDCDYYESMRDALEFIDRFASPKATIIADDYGLWAGARLAVDQWLGSTRRKVWVHQLRTGPVILRLNS